MVQDDLKSMFYTYADINPLDLPIKDFADSLLMMAESYIYETYNHSIFLRQETEILHGTGSNYIYLSKAPIFECVSILESGVVMPSVSIASGSKLFFREYYTSIGEYNIEVIYYLGYEHIEDVPTSLLNAVMSIAKKMLQDNQKNLDNINSISSDTRQSIRPKDSLPHLVETLLEPFRVYSL